MSSRENGYGYISGLETVLTDRRDEVFSELGDGRVNRRCWIGLD